MSIPASFAGRGTLPPELRFLLDVAATGFGGASPRPDPGIRWPEFLAAVRYHRLAPLMGPAVSPEVPVPDAVRAELAGLRRRVTVNMLALGAELARIAGAFAKAGVEVLAIKGPAQAVLFHGDPARRWCRDLDLLVRPEAEADALEILRGLGYGVDGGEMIRYPGVVFLTRSASPVPVELHTRLAEDDRRFPMAGLRPFETAVPVAIGGVPVPTLNIEAAAVYAAYHGAKHLWSRLYWIADLAAAAHGARIDWASALDLARRVGTDRHLGLAMLLVRDMTGLPLPVPIAADARLVASARRAAATLDSAGVHARPVADDREFRRKARLRFLWWDLFLYSRPAARWALLSLRARPGDLDRRIVRLPRGLGFLYYGVRILRLLGGSLVRWAAAQIRSGKAPPPF